MSGLPMHRDVGLVSVNIMLNDNNDFDGGGTFFENDMEGPLTPKGAGYALLHESSQRHGGVKVTRGVRDIWVVFVSSRRIPKHRAGVLLPHPREQATRLKIQVQLLEEEIDETSTSTITTNYRENLELRLRYLCLAVKCNPKDEEALHQLGMVLHKMNQTDSALECLRRSTELAPNNADFGGNLGVVLMQR
eukprot:CAMPEP_0194447008 /NCGR_PEP_ID=MMETSP0176-20130528/128764_1 /TAXON_ID=216777 /ORGANISM="Proboscia alata, Strain PI-D3" /LENGTH=190 /DNA_ID=CAMNT_0039273799 /DNA_START=819 /DNA_END=1387 /DNA_ORIENTATION=-